MQDTNSHRNNGVNGVTQNLNNALPGRETHIQQVRQDRYPATAVKNNQR